MSQSGAPPHDQEEISGLRARRDALRQAAALPEADMRATLEAALAELDASLDALTAARRTEAADPAQSPGELHAERRLLRAVFQDAPVPLFLLEPDGTVRRANRAAAELLGAGTGYATGKPFTALVDLRSRAAVHSQLAAIIRTGKARTMQCEMLTSQGTHPAVITVALTQPRGEADQLVVVVSGGLPSSKGGPPLPAPPVVAAMTRRMDLITAISRLLLENATLNEAVTLQRCARLLADELATWVIVDVTRGGKLRRQTVLGPEDERSAGLARAVSGRDPEPGSIPSVVHVTRSSQLIAHAEDPGALGDGPGGLPLLMELGATSLLSVPLAESERAYGALTLARSAQTPPFTMADLGLVEELGEQLALAIKMDREVRRHTEITDALRESLLPRRPPQVPGTDIAIAHVAATETPEVGGDFCDVFRNPAGWGLAIGDVCGRGGGVAAASAAARHAIRVVAHSTADPAAVLAQANTLMLAEEFGGRFVTACVAAVRRRGRALRVTLASAGHPPAMVIHPDGRADRLNGGGLPLGIFPDITADVELYDLDPGDVLLLFTDGLTDARGRPSGYFGDRLSGEAAALAGQPPRQILDRLQELALEFCGGEVRDDITALALRVAEPLDGGPG